jgi:hypothetical protein
LTIALTFENFGKTRAGGEVSAAGVKDFVLLRDSCPLTGARPLAWGKTGGGGEGGGDVFGASVFLSFAHQPVLANGWALTTSGQAGSEGLDPMYFVIDVSQGLSEAELAVKTFSDCLVSQVC